MRYLSFAVILMLAIVKLSLAQTPNSFQIDIQLLNPEKLEELYISDVDLQNFGTSDDIFSLTIRNSNPGQSYPNCFLELSFLRITRNGSLQQILTARSEPFTIPQGFTEKTVTNKELSVSGFDFGQGNIAYFHQVEVSPEADNLKNEILASGKLPFGIYKIYVRLFQQSQSPVDLGQNEIVLLRAINPSFIQLITPGAPAGQGMIPDVYSQFPIFQWTGNGDEYQVLVFEKKEMMQSLDDIVNSQPNWASSRTSRLSLQYPQSGEAIPLEYGKTYYWMVRMFVTTSGGEETLDSEVWAFNLVNPEQTDNLPNQMIREDILRFLAQVLGPNIEEVRASLNGYHLKRIRYNGQEIDLNRLYQILNQYRGTYFRIVDFIPPTPER